MSDQPSLNCEAENYDRPNQRWLCGRATDGRACALGPDAAGACRATFECRPVKKKRRGYEDDEWSCTRTKKQGGPCEDGPRPDGACCRPVPPCQPAPSLRTQRGHLCLMVSGATLATMLLLFFLPGYGDFINPGTLSTYHSGENFTQLSHEKTGGDQCSACHSAAQLGPKGWLVAGLKAIPRPWNMKGMLRPSHDQPTTIDRSCVECHPRYEFHQPNVTREHSCTLCHLEHQGDGRMPAPQDLNCASCHNDAATMLASLERAKDIPPEEFDYWHTADVVLFPNPRPPHGFTNTFATFSRGHPEFQLRRDQMRDGNTLRFNHQKHLDDKVLLNGQELTCIDCHALDASGAHLQRISYEQHCQSCHSLQFDPEIDSLRLPHGDAVHVRRFLSSLPAQYADEARRLGSVAKDDIDQFVRKQMARMNPGPDMIENLTKAVFLTGDPSRQPRESIARAGLRPTYNGCAYCHEVTSDGLDQPRVTPPLIPDCWMSRGRFNHAKHLNVNCEECHPVRQSRDTSDILLPTKASCASCHSPKGGVSESCSLCHSYHNAHRRLR